MARQMVLWPVAAPADPVWARLPGACRDRAVGLYAELAVRAAREEDDAMRRERETPTLPSRSDENEQ